jgi:NAD(P)H-dependent FMN reductase
MAPDPLHTAVIIGSTRAGRFAPTVARWFAAQAAPRDDLVLDVIDLLEVDLPHALAGHRDASVDAYAARIARADAFVVITPEYNHGYPAPLKQAIDLCHSEWQRKVAAFVSYGGVSGGLRAVEQLRQVFAEVHVATVRDGVSFPLTNAPFDDHGELREPDGPSIAAATMLDQLVWWGSALRTARRETGRQTSETAA